MENTDLNLEVRELERLISRLKGVSDVVVVSVQQPSGGRILKAFVELESNNQLNEHSIINHCLLRSSRGRAPSSVTFCKIPRTPSGKVARQFLLDQCAV
ncbi:MAG: hypothetical protein K6T66_05150 [Peptococcaceae bacterium]|nr:hypothetical protein [Peptococcaceae bacterium]